MDHGRWSCDPEVVLQTPKPRKIQRHEKVTQKWLSGSQWKWLKSDSKVTKTVEKVTFESLLSNFWVTFTETPKVTFESLFRVFEFFGVWGSVGLPPGHKTIYHGPWNYCVNQRAPNLRAATLQKCGSEIVLRFSLSKMLWNLAWFFSVLRFPGFGCARENFTKISRQKRCE